MFRLVLQPAIDFFVKIAALAETLDQMGVSEPIKNYILSQNPNKTRHYIAKLRQNPAISLEELQAEKKEVPKEKIEKKEKELPAELELAYYEILRAHPKNKHHSAWILRELQKGYNKNDLIGTLELYYKEGNRLEKKELRDWDARELESALKDLKLSARQQKKQEVSGGSQKLYEDDNWALVRIDTKRSCQILGSGSKWCVTQSDATYYEQYSASNVLFYFLLPKSSDNDKYAFAVQRDLDNSILEIDIFNGADDQIRQSQLMDLIGRDLVANIYRIIQDNAVIVPKSIVAKLGAGEASQNEVRMAIEGAIPGMEEVDVSRLLDHYDLTPELWSLALDKLDEEKFQSLLRRKDLTNFPIEVFNRIVQEHPDYIKSVLASTMGKLNPEIIRAALNSEDISPYQKENIYYRSDIPCDLAVELLNDSNNSGILKTWMMKANYFHCKEVFDQYAVNNPDFEIRGVVAAFSQNPEVLSKLVNDPERWVLEQLAGNENTPKEVIEKLSQSHDQDLLLAIVRSKIIDDQKEPGKIIDNLIENGNFYIVQPLIYHGSYLNLSDQQLNKIIDKFKDDKFMGSIAGYLLQNYKDRISVMERLIDIPNLDTLIYWALAELKLSDEGELKLIAKGIPSVIDALARNPFLSDNAMRAIVNMKMEDDRFVEYLELLANRKYLPPDVEVKLLEKANKNNKIAEGIAKFTDNPELLNQLSKTPSFYVLYYLAYNPNSTPEILSQISRTLETTPSFDDRAKKRINEMLNNRLVK